MFDVCGAMWDDMAELYRTDPSTYRKIIQERPGMEPPELRVDYTPPKRWQFWKRRRIDQ